VIGEICGSWFLERRTRLSPGEIYRAEHATGQDHPFLIVSRNELNRGKRVIGVNITSVDVERRSAYPNCIRIAAGQFGLGKDSVIQCENVVALNRATRSVIAT